MLRLCLAASIPIALRAVTTIRTPSGSFELLDGELSLGARKHSTLYIKKQGSLIERIGYRPVQVDILVVAVVAWALP